MPIIPSFSTEPAQLVVFSAKVVQKTNRQRERCLKGEWDGMYEVTSCRNDPAKMEPARPGSAVSPVNEDNITRVA